MFRLGLWLKMRFIAISMVSWNEILVKRLVPSCKLGLWGLQIY